MALKYKTKWRAKMFMPSLKVSNDVTSRVITLTPKLAQEFLAKNQKNRPINWTHVKRLAEAIKNDEWQLNGETIVISSTGALIQGQHRCLAVTKAMKDIKILLVENVSDDAFHTFDSGRKRTTSDVFAIKGEKNSITQAAAARLMYIYQYYGKINGGNQSMNPTSVQLLNTIEKYPIIAEGSSYAVSRQWIKKYIPKGLAAFCYAVFHLDNHVKAKEFFDQLETGIGLSQGSPILLLRSRLMEDYGKKRTINNEYRAALIFKSYKLFKSGGSYKVLRVTYEGKIEDDAFVL